MTRGEVFRPLRPHRPLMNNEQRERENAMSRKVLFLLASACVFLAAGSRIALPGAPDSTKPNAGEIVFELKYRGLTGAKGEPRIGMMSGFSSPREAQSPFTQSLNLSKEKVMYLSLPTLQATNRDERWSALEIEGDRSVAFYMDLDGDGKLSPNEKILPSMEKPPMGEGSLYVTPDFKTKTKNGKESLYRVFLIDQLYRADNGKVRHSPMFSPACLWEGTGTIEGKPFHVVLFDDNFDGLFAQFGEDKCALLPEAEHPKALESAYFPRERLSRLVSIGQQIYSLRVETTADGARPARVVLKKSEIPLGKLALEFKGAEGVKAEFDNVYLSQGNEVFFNLTRTEGKERNLPIGSYQVLNGAIRYGSARLWRTVFDDGPVISVG